MSDKFQRRHFEFIADEIAPLLPWPSHIDDLSRVLEKTNRNFNPDRFISRATQAWNDRHGDAIDAMADALTSNQ